MFATLTWNFKRVILIMDGAHFTTIFEDGHRKVQDFHSEIDAEGNWNQAWGNGYGADILRYYQEHDFVHHWLAERLHGGISEAIRYGDDEVPVREASLSIKYEEMLVHRIQQTLRMEASTDWIEAWEGEDGTVLISDLKKDLVECFGSMDLYPGANAAKKFNQYWDDYVIDPQNFKVPK